MTIDATSNDSATSWRDLADQLTPQQVARAEKFEREGIGTPAELADFLLYEAKEHAAKNIVDKERFGNVPAPADQLRIWHWEQAADGSWSREFDGTSRDLGTSCVSIVGVQRDNGSIERWVHVDINDSTELYPQSLRDLAAALVTSADELEALAAAEPVSAGGAR